ncbi:MAG: hypothetical protein AAF446_09300, partial [Pseudomonadota bacterium]
GSFPYNAIKRSSTTDYADFYVQHKQHVASSGTDYARAVLTSQETKNDAILYTSSNQNPCELTLHEFSRFHPRPG